MTTREINAAMDLLETRAARFEVCGLGCGGMSLTVYWPDGGRAIFHTLHQVRRHIKNH